MMKSGSYPSRCRSPMALGENTVVSVASWGAASGGDLLGDNREQLHFPFKLVEVLRKLDHDAVAGPASGKSGRLVNAVAAGAEMAGICLRKS
jgi:hypothetical protein